MPRKKPTTCVLCKKDEEMAFSKGVSQYPAARSRSVSLDEVSQGYKLRKLIAISNRHAETSLRYGATERADGLVILYQKRCGLYQTFLAAALVKALSKSHLRSDNTGQSARTTRTSGSATKGPQVLIEGEDVGRNLTVPMLIFGRPMHARESAQNVDENGCQTSRRG